MPVDPLSFRLNFDSCDATLVAALTRTVSLCKLKYGVVRQKLDVKCLIAISTVLVLYTMLISVVQIHTHAKRHKNSLKIDVALLTSTLSASPAIIRKSSVLNLLKFVFICWCEYYLTLSSTQILLGLCIRAFRY